MKKINWLLIGLLVSTNASANAHVLLWWQGKAVSELKYPTPVNLSDALLAPAIKHYEVYWPAAHISNSVRKQELEHKRGAVIRDLSSLVDTWQLIGEDGLVKTAISLKKQLLDLRLTGRFYVDVDPDISLAPSGYNPSLEGHYDLYLSPRRTKVFVAGLLTQPGEMPILPAEGIRQYWRKIKLLDGADTAHVYLIHPNGKSDLVPVAIWNEQHVEAMPGATLFIGFSNDILPKKYKNINQQILDLLANRMPE